MQYGDTTAFVGFLAAFVIIALVLAIISFVVNFYPVALTQLFGLGAFGFKPVSFPFSKYIRYLFLMIVESLVAFLWSFNKKLRAVQWICIICFVILGIVFVSSIPISVETYSFLADPPGIGRVMALMHSLLLIVILFIPYIIIVVRHWATGRKSYKLQMN